MVDDHDRTADAQLAADAERDRRDRAAIAAPEAVRRNPLALIAGGLVAILAVVLLARACSHAPVAQTDVAPTDATAAAVPAGPVAAAPSAYVPGSLAAYLAGNQPLPYTYELGNVTFDSGSAKLGSGARDEIADLAAALQARGSARVSVRGYADPAGDAAANQTLSQDRADAVRDALVAAGAGKDQIDTAALGETGDAAVRANRKVELTVTQR